MDSLDNVFSVLRSIAFSGTCIRTNLPSVFHSLREAIYCTPLVVEGLWFRLLAIASRHHTVNINHADFKWITFIYAALLQRICVDESSAPKVGYHTSNLHIHSHFPYIEDHHRSGISVTSFTFL